MAYCIVHFHKAPVLLFANCCADGIEGYPVITIDFATQK